MRIITLLALMGSSLFINAQSKLMRELSDTYPEAFVLMFYHSSLNMLNIDDDPDFARMIHDIDKIKVLRINKKEENFTNESLVELKSTIIDKGYENLMVIKSKEMNIGVFILEDDNEILGFFLLMDEDEYFWAIDLLGSMQVGDIGQLVSKIKEVKDL